MAVRTGKVILSKNILLDKDHKNIINYTETQMVTLLSSNTHLVGTYTDCSFVKQGESKIDVPMPYGTALQANYMAFQNPDYSNKWFFAFIDSVEYKSDGMTRITFTVDDLATWYDNWSPRACFVIREHTNDDTFGSNIVPENLELGDYINNGEVTNFGLGGGGAQTYSGFIVVNSIYSPEGTETKTTDLNGIPISGGIYLFDNFTSFQNAITRWANNAHLDSINMVYLLPENAFDSTNLTVHYPTDPSKIYWTFNGSNVPRTITRTFTTPTRLNGYKPVNNKLWTSPYQCLMVSNNNGSSVAYQFEYFTDPANITLECAIACSVGGSMVVYPQNYKNVSSNLNESIIGGKWPTLSWSADAYTNWLTQNSVNIGIGIGSTIGGLILGGSDNKPGDIFGGITSIANQMAQIRQHSLMPETTRGNVNGGDVMTGYGLNQFYCYYMSIRADMAERIDNYFTRYGYATNKIKVPNQTGRPYWNYIQIASDDVIGYSNNAISVPTSAMLNINTAYRNGVTIWHNHDNIGNYSLDNSLVTE